MKCIARKFVRYKLFEQNSIMVGVKWLPKEKIFLCWGCPTKLGWALFSAGTIAWGRHHQIPATRRSWSSLSLEWCHEAVAENIATNNMPRRHSRTNFISDNNFALYVLLVLWSMPFFNIAVIVASLINPYWKRRFEKAYVVFAINITHITHI